MYVRKHNWGCAASLHGAGLQDAPSHLRVRVNVSSVVKVVHVVECTEAEAFSALTLLPEFRGILLLAWGAKSNIRACRAMLKNF